MALQLVFSRLLAVCFSRIWVESGESLGRKEIVTRRDWDETGCVTHEKKNRLRTLL